MRGIRFRTGFGQFRTPVNRNPPALPSFNPRLSFGAKRRAYRSQGCHLPIFSEQNGAELQTLRASGVAQHMSSICGRGMFIVPSDEAHSD